VQIALRQTIDDAPKCSIIDWDAGGFTNVVHSFDRPQDKEWLYALMELSEQLSRPAVVQKRSLNFGSPVGPWVQVTDQLKFVDTQLVTTLKRYGYLREMRSHVRRDGQLKEVPNWRNIAVFPTSCGTFVFVRYQPNCRLDTTGDGLYDTSHQVIVSGNSGFGEEDVVYGDDQLPYFLAGFYQSTVPLAAIAEKFYDEAWARWNQEWLTALQSTQMVAELVPFVSSGVALVRIVDSGTYQFYGPVSASDQLGMAGDVLLDAIPVLAQARKLRASSKLIYAIGSTAVVATTLARVGINGEIKIDDALRVVVLGIVGLHIRNLPPGEIAADVRKASLALGLTSTGKVAHAVNEVRQYPSYVEAVANAIRDVLKPFKIDLSLPPSEHLQALIIGFRLDELGNIGQQIIRRFVPSRERIVRVLDAIAQNSSTTQISTLVRELKDLARAAEKQIHEIPVDLPDVVWDHYRAALSLATMTVRSSGVPPNTPEYARAVNNLVWELIDGSRPSDIIFGQGYTFQDFILYVMKNNPHIQVDGPHYFTGLQEIFVPEVKLPTHFYTKADGTSVYLKIGDDIPTSGPNGEMVREMDWVIPGTEDTGRDVLNRWLGLIDAEEITHGLAHVRTSSGYAILPDGSKAEVEGVGLIKTFDQRHPLGFLSFSIFTPNCQDWISKLRGEEIKAILIRRWGQEKFDGMFGGMTLDEIKHQAVDAAEMDIFFTLRDAGVHLTKEFIERYASRVLAVEFLNSVAN
jgi:hypothetical protein